eukprot:3671860-Amphidinium_carterae.1
MSYASELQAVHEASLMYREQLQEEYASKTEMVREASIKVEVLKGKDLGGKPMTTVPRPNPHN